MGCVSFSLGTRGGTITISFRFVIPQRRPVRDAPGVAESCSELCAEVALPYRCGRRFKVTFPRLRGKARMGAWLIPSYAKFPLTPPEFPEILGCPKTEGRETLRLGFAGRDVRRIHDDQHAGRHRVRSRAWLRDTRSQRYSRVWAFADESDIRRAGLGVDVAKGTVRRPLGHFSVGARGAEQQHLAWAGLSDTLPPPQPLYV
jgi:hypothetical protein